MRPTRAWLEGDDLLLRFNVMQGPDQDPLAPGRWVLTAKTGDVTGRGRPVTVTDRETVAWPAERTFATERGDYRVVAEHDPDGTFALRVRLDPSKRRLVTAVKTVLRPVRTVAYRVAFMPFRWLARRDGRRVLFASDSGAELSGNLGLVHDRMVERGLDREYELRTLLRASITVRRRLRDLVRLPWLLARADVIVIDDYYPILYRLRFDDEVRIVQLWHASGPFKTVGYSRVGKVGGPGAWSRIHKCYTHAIVSSEADVPYYAEAFGIAESRVVPTGIPRMDRYFDEGRRRAGRQAALDAFPMVRDRFTILFAPTFRGDTPRDAWYDPAWIDLPALHALAVERDAAVIIRMHPFVQRPLRIPAAYADRIIDGSAAPVDVNDLLFAVDLLVTDYSSIVFEYSTLGRPMLFYTPDLDEYIAGRDVYIPFEQFVPGRIVRTFPELLDAIRRHDVAADKVAAFAARHFSHLDGGSTDRVIDKVILAR